MTCTCPKCHASVQLDVSEVPDQGTTATCPSCQTSFNLYREPFSGRAFRKWSELSCANCGEQLSVQNHCPTCGAPFPDYVVAGLGKRKSVRKVTKLELKSSPFQRRTKTSITLPTLDQALNQNIPSAGTASKVHAFAKGKNLAIAAVVIVALVAGGTGLYLKKKAEDAYLKNLAIATYGIHLGADKCRKISQRMGSDWKANQAAAQSYVARPTMTEERDLEMISTKLSSVKAQLADEPARFKGTTANLIKIEAPFNKMRTQVLNPGNSLPGFLDTMNKLDADYNAGTASFKSSLSPDVLESLKKASERYLALRPFFNK